MSKKELARCGYTRPSFTLAGTKCWARLVACHDGDSPTLVFPYAGRMHKFHTRMYGIDTCEMTSKDVAVKERAVKARDRLIQLCTQRQDIPVFKSDKEIVNYLSQDTYVVWVRCMDFDKYARPLVHLKRAPEDNKTFSDVLVEENLAYRYYGATKLTEQEQAVALTP